MSSTTVSDNRPPISWFKLPLDHHSELSYAFCHEKMTSLATPGRLRLIDFKDSHLGDGTPNLCFLEMHRAGDGAVGYYSKCGFAQHIAERMGYSSVVSRFDAGGPDTGRDSPTGEVQPSTTMILKDILKFFDNKWRDTQAAQWRYLWIDHLCIMQGGTIEAEKDRQWHDIEFQKDIHVAAAQQFVLPKGLSSVVGTPYPHLQSLRGGALSGPGPFVICRRTIFQSSGNPLILNALSSFEGNEKDVVQSVMKGMAGGRPRPTRDLSEDQAIWKSLFARKYNSYHDFIRVCREALLVPTTRDNRSSESASSDALAWHSTLTELASQLSRDLHISAWFGVAIGTPDPAFSLFPTIPLESQPSTPDPGESLSILPLFQRELLGMVGEGALFVMDKDLHAEVLKRGHRTLVLKNARAHKFVRSADLRGTHSRSLQFEWDHTRRSDWVPMYALTPDKVSQGDEVWLVYIGSMKDPVEKSQQCWRREPNVQIIVAKEPSNRTRKKMTSASQAAANHVDPPTPGAQTHRFAALTVYHDVDIISEDHSNDGEYLTYKHMGWIEKEVAGYPWLNPNRWTRVPHHFTIVQEGAAPPYEEIQPPNQVVCETQFIEGPPDEPTERKDWKGKGALLE